MLNTLSNEQIEQRCFIYVSRMNVMYSFQHSWDKYLIRKNHTTKESNRLFDISNFKCTYKLAFFHVQSLEREILVSKNCHAPRTTIPSQVLRRLQCVLYKEKREMIERCRGLHNECLSAVLVTARCSFSRQELKGQLLLWSSDLQ